MKKKVVIFIDVVSHKNQLQIESIFKYGLEPHIFVAKYKASSNSYFDKGGTQELLNAPIFKRLRQVNSFFKNNKKNIHHVEVYPGDLSSFLYLLVAKFYKIRSICIERGNVLLFRQNGYNRLSRFAMWLCYRFSDIIWYKEPYMKPVLEKFNKNLYFLHNSISINPESNRWHPEKKDITFLWLNRVIPQRRYDWFVDLLKKPEFVNTQNYLVGIIPDSLYKQEQEYVINNKPANLTVEEYCSNPDPYYKVSKFFVLPADVVFANHSLLEAMSYGVVPLVSDQTGTELIVENGKNGFVYDHTKKDLEDTLVKALQLTDERYQELSNAAKEKVKQEFSEEGYYNRIKQLYDTVQSRN
jgi:glycosyltransferase involved in cell wall biosynthesis